MRCGVSSRLIVYGAGGHSKTIAATLEAMGEYQIVGLLDDDQSRHDTESYGYQVLGGREKLDELRGAGVSAAFVAIGDNHRRAEVERILLDRSFDLVQAIHPSCVLLRGCQVGAGAAVLPNAFVGSDAVVGHGAIISVAACISHDVCVGPFAQICPNVGLAGGAEVGPYSFIGMGATVLPKVKLGRDVVVGANAVVTGDLPDGVTVVGVPARITKRRRTGE